MHARKKVAYSGIAAGTWEQICNTAHRPDLVSQIVSAMLQKATSRSVVACGGRAERARPGWHHVPRHLVDRGAAGAVAGTLCVCWAIARGGPSARVLLFQTARRLRVGVRPRWERPSCRAGGAATCTLLHAGIFFPPARRRLCERVPSIGLERRQRRQRPGRGSWRGGPIPRVLALELPQPRRQLRPRRTPWGRAASGGRPAAARRALATHLFFRFCLTIRQRKRIV
jgi:hypothetical protein